MMLGARTVYETGPRGPKMSPPRPALGPAGPGRGPSRGRVERPHAWGEAPRHHRRRLEQKKVCPASTRRGASAEPNINISATFLKALELTESGGRLHLENEVGERPRSSLRDRRRFVAQVYTNPERSPTGSLCKGRGAVSCEAVGCRPFFNPTLFGPVPCRTAGKKGKRNMF